jgi:hypothetical protein
MLSQEFDALAVVLCGIGIIKHSRPRCRVLDDKGETRPLQIIGATVFQLRDREPVGIVVLRRRDIPISKGEDPDIDLSLLNILETLIDGSLVGGDVAFHRQDLMVRLAQRLEDHASVLFEVLVG